MGASASSKLARLPSASSFSTTGAYRKEMPSPPATRDLMVLKSLMVTNWGKLPRVRFCRRRASSKIARVPEPSSRMISRSPYTPSSGTERPASR